MQREGETGREGRLSREDNEKDTRMPGRPTEMRRKRKGQEERGTQEPHFRHHGGMLLYIVEDMGQPGRWKCAPSL